ncbi:unnamed protein product [Rotaria sp. Silwood1]|nr:unnamed protein product [Rotaria sp. Silwood1]CAF3441594.1 unnamed protein product [Rotaria sp. Silwood1]CAF3442267.1 unnamed protein product [Rotaria sp. Silwood1]CAF4689050.1 unnamed protein product [Rotaria sp. Silwood1]CAF4696662.1 unnamed protein product [Rotaria sp. Silwood1]
MGIVPKMISLYVHLLLVVVVAGSHYRGGAISYTIRAIPDNITGDGQQIPVRVMQRHSWRRSSDFCNDTSPSSGNLIGSGTLVSSSNQSMSSVTIPSIDTSVRCTDYNEEFDYSSGENSADVLLPINSRIEYLYQGCCWITLLSPDSESDWSLKLIVNTYRRPDGRLNSSPKTTMNPIVQVEVGKIGIIRIPMADSDGDPVRCRWGNSKEECGSICTPKGYLQSNPCQLTYNASRLGYHAVALVIEDFDSNDNVLSSIPLQFLIHIVNITTDNCSCTDPPIYIGEWPEDSCIGVQSNTTINARIQIRIPCENTCTTLQDILTVSPAGLIKGEITSDPINKNIYTMPIEWTPEPDQYGIHQLCVTPVDSQQQTGSQVCLTFQVDVNPPEFIRMTPTGFIFATQSSWTLETDRDIIRPRRSSGVYIRFFKRVNNEEVYRVDVASDVTVFYQPRTITFFTTQYTWEENEEYYVLLDAGVATLNESCGVESNPINNPHAWTFRVAVTETTNIEEIDITEQLVSSITTQQTTTKRQQTTTTTTTQLACPRWLHFDTISNESTNANETHFTFCFSVNTTLADVTISANTWVSCRMWKSSGAADPLLELYSEENGKLLAQNDDGNSFALQNCYAAVLSYRLQRGDYRVIIRNPKCAYGKFELRLSAEIDRNLK